MTIFVDASALVAMATHESDGEDLEQALDRHYDRLYCATGAWEAARAIARLHAVSVLEARDLLDLLLHDLGFKLVPIGEVETRIAIDAHHLYGKETGHPANLNMGDCFAYACAKANDAVLLYKGNDFAHTDLA